jgi:hypothetical protein
MLHCACERHDGDHARSVLDDIASMVGASSARKWGRLTAAVLADDGLRRGDEPVRPVAAARTVPPSPDIRRLTALGLAADTSWREGRDLEPALVMELRTVVAAGARSSLGWPFDLTSLALRVVPR